MSAAAPPRCRGQKATKVGTAGDDHISGTEGRDVIVGLGGHDLIESSGGSDIVCGGAGDDELYGGTGNDVLVGGAGDDSLIGAEGSDRLLGGPGDNYFVGNAGNDVIKGKRGFDYADFRTSALAVAVDLAAGTATGDGDDTLSGLDMVAGTELDDHLMGSAADFELYLGLGGDDTIDGRAGTDQLVFDESPAGVTADVAAGTATGEGSDTFTSIESIQGSAFDDTLLGHDAQDDLYGFTGNDVIDGRGGNDYLLGNGGDDEISGGPGEYDMIDFDPGAPAVTVNMATGVSTGEGTDQVSGFEIIGGSEFDDTLIGDATDNLFYSYAGDDAIDGGNGSDLVLYNIAAAPITADLVAGFATGEGSDTFTSVEGFVGSNFNDSLSGDANVNVLIGGPGNDELVGLDGNDYFEGGAGNDTIDGGAGTFDMADYFSAPKGVSADLQTKVSTGSGHDSLDGVEALLGSPFDDSFVGDTGSNYFFGADGNDDLSGGAGDDGLDGGSGNDGLDGGPGTDECVAGESTTACEGDNPTPPTEDLQRLQELLGVLGEVVGREP
jgi:Ca2+-binding RTX toxin-like protein